MLCMETTVQDIKSSLDPEYEVEDIGEGYKVSNPQTEEAGVVTFGRDDGNAYMEVDSWTEDDTTRIYENQDHGSDTFLDETVLEGVLMDEDIEDIEAEVKATLSNGLDQAYDRSNKVEQAEMLLTSAHEAYQTLESQGKGVGRFSLNARKQSSLGNAVLHYGEAPDNDEELDEEEKETMGLGTNDVKIGLEEFEQDEDDRGYATSATYIMGAILLNESNSDQKPRVSTGKGYKEGSDHHDLQEDKADMELVNTASEISEYNLLN